MRKYLFLLILLTGCGENHYSYSLRYQSGKILDAGYNTVVIKTESYGLDYSGNTKYKTILYDKKKIIKKEKVEIKNGDEVGLEYIETYKDIDKGDSILVNSYLDAVVLNKD